MSEGFTEVLEGEFVDLTEDEMPDVVDTEDGGAFVQLGESTAPGETEHFANLAEELLSDQTLNRLATNFLELIERDKEARKKRDEQYEEGIRRTGLGNDAPGGAQFDGASRVVHPVLTKVCVEFASRTIKELWPPNGPVKSKIIGDVTKDKVAKATRKSDFMNVQMTVQAKEARAELEQMLTQLPLGGSQYIKLSWDHRRKRPTFQFVAIDDVLLPFAASNYYTAQRKTHVQYLTKLQYEQMVEDGVYVDIDLPSPGMMPDQTAAAKATDKIEGKQEDVYNDDGLRTTFEVAATVDIEEDPETDGPAPYLITIDQTSRRVLSVYRNWREDDEAQEELQWMAEFSFIPWRGAYGIGIGHMIGGLAGAATGALRALLDSAHIANSQAMVKLKGGSRGGQSLTIQPTEILEIEGGVAVDDIRKLAMPLPFNGPSEVLFQLLGFLVNEASDVVRVTMSDVAETSENAPVGSTLALIEQGLETFSSIFGRLHDSMGRMLGILHTLDAMYLDEQVEEKQTGEVIAKRADFEGPMDVVPVSDPNIFSEAQRFAQIQAVAQRAQLAPDLYNRRKVEERILQTLKIPDGAELLAPEMEPKEENAVSENVKASLGKPIVAFPDQDHIAHLMTHISFLESPIFGSNPLIAPAFVPTMLGHIKEHLVLWYAAEAMNVADEGVGPNESLSDLLAETKSPQDKAALDALVAEASLDVLHAAPMAFEQIQQVIAKAMEMAKALAPPPLPDPASQVAAQDIAMRGKLGSEKNQTEMLKLQVKREDDIRDDETRRAEIAAETARNTEDNRVALELAAAGAERASQDPNPNPRP